MSRVRARPRTSAAWCPLAATGRPPVLRTCAPAACDLRTLGATAASSLPLVADLHASDAARSAFARRGVTAWPRVRLSVHGASRSSPCVCWRAGVPLVPLVRSAQGRGVPRGGKARAASEAALCSYMVAARRSFCILRQPHLQLSTRHSLSIPDTAKDLCTLYAAAPAMAAGASVGFFFAGRNRTKGGMIAPSSHEKDPY